MMTGNCFIRPAVPRDDLTGIWQAVYEVDHAPLLPAGVHAPFQPTGEPYVAVYDGAVVGFSFVDNEWLDEVWVAKHSQGRGVGTLLIRHAEALMSCSGIPEAALTVWQTNVRAIALYQRLGWFELRTFVSKANGEKYVRMGKSLVSKLSS
jgi:ribosomal protein S18 acetylase RimI-like enzyme